MRVTVVNHTAKMATGLRFGGSRSRAGGQERSAVNLLIKYLLFFSNFLIMLGSIGLAAATTYVLVLKGKVVKTALDFFFDPSCLLCTIGCIAAVVCFFGCAGSLRENVCFLKTYYITVSFLLLLEIVAIVFVFVFYYVPDAATTLNLYPQDVLKEAVVKYRDDLDMQNLIDSMQSTLQCCGVSNDNKGYLDWNDNIYFNCTPENKSPERCAVPFSCCKINAGDEINSMCGGQALSQSEPSQLTNIYTDGCLKGVRNFLDSNALVLGGVIIGILVPQALFVCMAKTLVSQIYTQMAKW